MASDVQGLLGAAPSSKARDCEYLCHAWGESVLPIEAITPNRVGVVAFLCDHWFGERPETMHEDNREAFDQIMADFDAEEWDMIDSIERKFEIGGLRVTMVADVGKRMAQLAPRAAIAAKCDVQSTTRALSREVALRAGTLHPSTSDLVVRFGSALAEKLAAAEHKFGYTDGWSAHSAVPGMRDDLFTQVGNGDPRDVAAYCAFLWHHGASTARADERTSQ